MAESTDRLAGKVALVTGAAHGIGAAVAANLHAAGARVVVMDLSIDAAEHLCSSWDGAPALAVRGDVAVAEEFAAAVRAGADWSGGLDILVNNAATGSAARIEELEVADWKRVMDVNFGGVLNGIRYAAPHMRERGGGAIVNISSVAARHAMYGMTAYAAAKAAVEAATRCAAIELRADNIRVNAVAPGMIRSLAAERSVPVLERAMVSSFDDYIAHRQRRWGEPAEVASVVAHLVSDEASFVTGQTHTVDDGASLLL